MLCASIRGLGSASARAARTCQGSRVLRRGTFAEDFCVGKRGGLYGDTSTAFGELQPVAFSRRRGTEVLG